MKSCKEECKEAAKAEIEEEIARANRLRNAANARAREVMKEAGKSERKIRRLEKKIEDLENAEMGEADDESSGHESSDDDEVEVTRRLPFELMPRRDDKGRFQAESPDVHALRIAQLGRGSAPSMVAKNIMT